MSVRSAASRVRWNAIPVLRIASSVLMSALVCAAVVGVRSSLIARSPAGVDRAAWWARALALSTLR
jgi:hypothetical protein